MKMERATDKREYYKKEIKETIFSLLNNNKIPLKYKNVDKKGKEQAGNLLWWENFLGALTKAVVDYKLFSPGLDLEIRDLLEQAVNSASEEKTMKINFSQADKILEKVMEELN
jgi:hypothetical protein